MTSHLRLSLLSIVATAACGTPAAPPAHIVNVAPEPAGAHCPVGGTVIETGVDVDGDGTLAAGEVTQTQYVCSGSDGSNGSDGSDGASGTSSLVRAGHEAPGANCAAGGTVLKFGADTNADGILDDGEVTQIQYVCNGPAGGATGLSSLVRLDSEPAGAHCAAGGTVVKVGLDADRNGTLSDDEVAQTQYVCAGAKGGNGNNGTDGLSSLIRLDIEPAGNNCTAGGLAIRTGLDANRNNVLDNAEIAATSYLCHDVKPGNPDEIIGTYVIHNQADAATFVGVRHVTGDLIIDASGLPAIDLHALERIDGSLAITNTPAPLSLPALTAVHGNVNVTAADLPSLELPALALVDGGLDVDGTSLTTLTIPQLAQVGFGLFVGDAPTLTSVNLPALAQIGGNLTVSNTAATSLALPALTSVGDVVVSSPSLATIAMPKLATAGQVSLNSPHLTAVDLTALTTAHAISINELSAATLALPHLESAASLSLGQLDAAQISLPVLAHVDGELQIVSSTVTSLQAPALKQIGSLFLTQDDKLVELSLPGATSIVTLDLNDNAALAKLALPALTSLGGLSVSGNHTLPACGQIAPLAHLVADASHVNVFDNLNDGGNCGLD